MKNKVKRFCVTSVDNIKIDKSITFDSSFKDIKNDLDYWKSRPPEERLAYVELLRQINYGKSATSARLQRILIFVRQT